MKLYLSYTSPFGRLCLLCAALSGHAGLKLHFVDVWQNPAELLAGNPFGQVPLLQTDSGANLYQSAIICRRLAGAPESEAVQQQNAYTLTLLEVLVQGFKLQKFAGDDDSHFFVRRSREALERALPAAPAAGADSTNLHDALLLFALLTVAQRAPETFAAFARPDTRQAVDAFSRLPLIRRIQTESLQSSPPDDVAGLLSSL